MYDVPVALVFFNRPELLRQVYNRVREQRPQQLFLIQDGVRDHRPDDLLRVEQCQDIVEQVDWECEIQRNYAHSNLGCGARVSTGISWVFEHVDRAIILEDDCVPDPSFFPYCRDMLERYKNDQRIMMVSGMNHLGEYSPDGSSYFFSKGCSIWGWATWKRAWGHFDLELNLWKSPATRQLVYEEIGVQHMQRNRAIAWDKTVKQLKENRKLSWWGPQWQFAIFANSGLGIVPKHNLITNIGVNVDATHESKKVPIFANMATKPLEEDLQHPPCVICDRRYDRALFKMVFPSIPLYIKVGSKVKRLLKRLVKMHLPVIPLRQ